MTPLHICLVQAIIISVVGSLMHFVYEASGESDIVAVLAPTDESVFSHMKLVLWPWIITAVIETIVNSSTPTSIILSSHASGMLGTTDSTAALNAAGERDDAAAQVVVDMVSRNDVSV